MTKQRSPLRPQAKVEIVKQSRDRWKDDAGTFAVALDAAQIVLDGGTREQQQSSAAGIRSILSLRGYPVREAL